MTTTLPRSSGWDRWLTAVVCGVIAYGALLVVAGGTASRLFELLGFGPDDGGTPAGAPTDYLRLIYGVLGAVIVGWFTLLLVVVRGPLRRRERWAWTAVVASATTWFVVDTVFSLVTGWPTHAAFNLAFAAGLAPPLVGLRRDCTRAP